MKTSKFSAKTVSMIAIMAALVFVGTNLRIKIPAGPDGTMLHLGNVFCLLGGLLFGGLPGGLAAGFGSAIFDLFSEYAAEAWITFILKFFMGFIAGVIAHGGRKNQPREGSERRLRTILAAAAGSVSYSVLYIIKTIIMQRFVYLSPWEGVWAVVGIKAAVTFTNGLVAIVSSLVLYYALKPALERARII
jgi:uncharacterized membrane protein